MRAFTLFLCALIPVFLAMPVPATECTNAGTAPAVAPDDTGDGEATVCGDTAVAAGESSTALGSFAYSAGTRSTALGYSASSAGNYSTSFGNGATSPASYSSAMGFTATSSGTYSMALGYDSTSGGDTSIAVGYFTTSAGAHSVALGSSADSPGGSSTALGRDASSAGGNSTALGYGASSAGVASSALGYFASSVGNNSTALGYLAVADQPNTVILGPVAGVNFATGYANVGMGTSAPSQAVDVERSGAAARFQLTSFTAVADEAPQYIQRRARGTRLAPTAVQNNDNLGLFSFRGHNGTAMGGSRATITAQAAGDFTGASTPTRLIFATTPVGQTTPQQVLVITPDGKVQVNGQNLTVPDYVFDDDYALMPLDELQEFIDANGHLPGIPSADEVNSGSHDLAGSDMSHLRKIEELTLYTLQLQGRVNDQHDRILTLEAQLAQVMARLD